MILEISVNLEYEIFRQFNSIQSPAVANFTRRSLGPGGGSGQFGSSKFFGEEIVDQARAVYLKGRVLTITCLSLTAARDIRISEGRIINEINKRFDNLQVEKIRYLA